MIRHAAFDVAGLGLYEVDPLLGKTWHLHLRATSSAESTSTLVERLRCGGHLLHISLLRTAGADRRCDHFAGFSRRSS